MSNIAKKVIFRIVARNAEDTIARAVESVLAQTYSNWELHLVNNGSEDKTGSIMKRYADSDTRIRVFTNEGNFVWKKGNRFFDYYTEYDLDNTFLCYLDGDDEYRPDFLEKMVVFAEDNKLDIAVCGFDSIYTKTNLISGGLHLDSALILEGEKYVTKFPDYYYYIRTRWGKLFKISLIEKMNISDLFDMPYGGDTIETLEFYTHAGRIGIYPAALYVYYVNPNTVSYKWYYERIESDRIIYDHIIKFLKKKGGSVSPENIACIAGNYLIAIESTVKVLLNAQISGGKKLDALYDIFTHSYTRNLKDYRFKFSEDKEILINKVYNWLLANENDLSADSSKQKTEEIISILKTLPGYNIEVETVIKQALHDEYIDCVLEISGYDARYGELVKESDEYYHKRGKYVTVDRIDLTDGGMIDDYNVYDGIFSSEAISDITGLKQYDIIIVFHLFENMAASDAKILLEQLLTKVNKQVLVITPEYPYDLESEESKVSNVRAYHPVFFLGMDFSFAMLDTIECRMQAYNFFPKADYEVLPCDKLPAVSGINTGKKLKIGYILCSHAASGGMKAVIRQMKILADRGHCISVYYRSDDDSTAIPGWCSLSNDDVHKQVVIPEGSNYLDYIKGEDVIVVTWLQMVKELEESVIPVALWEQGSPIFFGDYGGMNNRNSSIYYTVHNLYRKNVHMLAVTGIVQKVFQDVFKRKAEIYPLDIDTVFYHPAAEKNNEVPVVLFIGYPGKGHKGFKSAYMVLEAACQTGTKFKVQIVSQIDFVLTPEPEFRYEKIIDPPQEDLAEIYRNADILLLTSLFESFSLPPLEAMASGTAVIAMDCGGINEYAEPGVNCLLCEQGDINSMLYALTYLLSDADARERLAVAGRETAMKYSHENIAPVWEECLYKIVAAHTSGFSAHSTQGSQADCQPLPQDPQRLLSKIESIFVVQGILARKWGFMNSILGKMKLLEDKYGYVSTLLTTTHDIDLRKKEAWLRSFTGSEEIISPGTVINNIYEYFQSSYAEGLEDKAVFSRKGIKDGLRYEKVSDNSYAVRKGNELVRVDVYSGPGGCLRMERCYKNGIKEKDIYYDDWGYLNCVWEYDPDNEENCAVKYYTTGGQLRIEALFTIKDAQRNQHKVIVYGEDGSIDAEMPGDTELTAYYLSKIIPGGKESVMGGRKSVTGGEKSIADGKESVTGGEQSIADGRLHLLVLEAETRHRVAGLLRQNRENTAVVALVHNIFLNNAQDPASGPEPGFAYLCRNPRQFDGIVFLTNDEKDDFVKISGDFQNTFTIPHPYYLPVEKADFSKRDGKKAVIIARLVSEKQIGEAIEIFAEVVRAVPGACLEIYGTGDEQEKLEAQIKNLGMENNVFLKGYTNDPLSVYRQAAVFIMTSKFEGFPLSLIESICNGCPAFSYILKYGPPDIITDGVTGFLFPYGDKKGFAKKLVEYFSSPDMQREMSMNCYNDAARFSPGNFLDKWLRMVNTVYIKKLQ